MKLHPKLVVGLAVLAMGLVPTMAGAVSYQPEYQPEKPPNPPAKAPKGHAYGYYCKGFSKKHVKGQKGTPFSQCVRAMKVADHNENISARKACKQFKGQKHVPHGDKGTPFSRCIKGVNELRREKAATVTTSSVV
ncbi:MAG TPA: hypothetical protein VK480_00100 [Solirubrobacterales bacterium]|nr:hypothetical protein [Solirubrobacterales bacterium]